MDRPRNIAVSKFLICWWILGWRNYSGPSAQVWGSKIWRSGPRSGRLYCCGHVATTSWGRTGSYLKWWGLDMWGTICQTISPCGPVCCSAQRGIMEATFGQGVYVHMETQTVDNLSRLSSGTNSGINDGALTVHVWDGARRQMEQVTGQSYGAHTKGLWRQFSKGSIPVRLPLYQVPRIGLNLELPQESLKSTAMGI